MNDPLSVQSNENNSDQVNESVSKFSGMRALEQWRKGRRHLLPGKVISYTNYHRGDNDEDEDDEDEGDEDEDDEDEDDEDEDDEDEGDEDEGDEDEHDADEDDEDEDDEDEDDED